MGSPGGWDARGRAREVSAPRERARTNGCSLARGVRPRASARVAHGARAPLPECGAPAHLRVCEQAPLQDLSHADSVLGARHADVQALTPLRKVRRRRAAAAAARVPSSSVVAARSFATGAVRPLRVLRLNAYPHVGGRHSPGHVRPRGDPQRAARAAHARRQRALEEGRPEPLRVKRRAGADELSARAAHPRGCAARARCVGVGRGGGRERAWARKARKARACVGWGDGGGWAKEEGSGGWRDGGEVETEVLSARCAQPRARRRVRVVVGGALSPARRARAYLRSPPRRWRAPRPPGRARRSCPRASATPPPS